MSLFFCFILFSLPALTGLTAAQQVQGQNPEVKPGNIWFIHRYHSDRFLFFFSLSVKPQSTSTESRSPSGSSNRTSPAASEKSSTRGEAKPDPATRIRATSSSSSPVGSGNPKPPVPQGAKPALAARPTIPQKPRTSSSSSSRTAGTLRAGYQTAFCWINLCFWLFSIIFHKDDGSESPRSGSVSPKVLHLTLKKGSSEKDKESTDTQEGESQPPSTPNLKCLHLSPLILCYQHWFI